MKPRALCTFPRCPNRSPCPVHGGAARAAYEAGRAPAHRRGYNAAWRRLRAAYLRAHEACEELGCPLRAREVHHRVPIAVAPSLRLAWGNLRALCIPHHRLAEAAARAELERAGVPLARGLPEETTQGGVKSLPGEGAATSSQSITNEGTERGCD